jgi:hypothetical protein
VVDIDHDVEVPPQGLADRPVDPPEKRRADHVRRGLAGMSRPPDRQPDCAEPGTAHVIEVTLPQLELRPARSGIQGVTEADSPPETAVHAIRSHAFIITSPQEPRCPLTGMTGR